MSEQSQGFFSRVKADLFTIRGLIVTVVHCLVLLGAVQAAIFVSVDVLGNVPVVTGRK